MYTHAHTQTHTHTHNHTQTGLVQLAVTLGSYFSHCIHKAHTCAWMYTLDCYVNSLYTIFVPPHTHTHTTTHSCTHTYTHTTTHTHNHTHTHTHNHTLMHTHTHTHTTTHSCTQTTHRFVLLAVTSIGSHFTVFTKWTCAWMYAPVHTYCYVHSLYTMYLSHTHRHTHIQYTCIVMEMESCAQHIHTLMYSTLVRKHITCMKNIKHVLTHTCTLHIRSILLNLFSAPAHAIFSI